MKYSTPHRLNAFSLVPMITQVFQKVLKRPAQRNLILMIHASIRTNVYRINTLAAKLPVAVSHFKTRLKRVLHFIDSDFPVDTAMKSWCVYVGRSLYEKSNRGLRIQLIDETDILKDYRVLVVAVPFRKRAIPIYWKINAKNAFDKLLYPSHYTLVKSFVCHF